MTKAQKLKLFMSWLFGNLNLGFACPVKYILINFLMDLS